MELHFYSSNKGEEERGRALSRNKYKEEIYCRNRKKGKLKVAIVEFADIFPPRSHDLIKLLGLTGIKTDAATQNFLAKLSYYYIETRYPEEVARIYKEVNKSLAREYLNKTKEIMNWLEKKLN